MNISSSDIALIFASALAIILMSFAFPAAGLADASNETAESDIPTFDISTGDFDFGQDKRPTWRQRRPASPTEGTLIRNESKTVVGDHQVWLDYPRDDGESLDLANLTVNAKTDEMQLIFTNFSGGSSVSSDKVIKNISTEGETIRFTSADYGIAAEVIRYEYAGTANMTAVVEWQLLQAPDLQGSLATLPVIGGIFSAGEQVTAGLAYLGDLIRWGFSSFLEATVNFGTVAVQTISFFVSLLTFMLSTYNSLLVNTSAAWATVLVSVPGILFALEFTKLTAVSIAELTPG